MSLRASSPAASGPAAQTAGSAGDEFDDSFLQDFDVDAAVRRHSTGPAGVGEGAKRAASGGADYLNLYEREGSKFLTLARFQFDEGLV